MVRSLIVKGSPIDQDVFGERVPKEGDESRQVVEGRSESGEQEGQLIKWLFPFSVAPSRFGKRDGH